MPSYEKLREMVSHRVAFDFDTGARVVGYLSGCKPSSGPVQLVAMSSVDVFSSDGSILEHHETFSFVPNALTGIRIAEGPRGRDA